MLKQKRLYIPVKNGTINCLVLRPKTQKQNLSGILCIHGGGYMLGMAGMVHMSVGNLLAKRFGAVVFSPGYHLAPIAPYPAAVTECYATLEYMWDHARELGIDPAKIIVGGESAGGGLAAAVCLMARDKGKIKVAMQIPLYTFVSEGEPFYQETLDYVRHLNEAGVKALVDVYPGNVHAFDILCPFLERSKEAKEKLCLVYRAWMMNNN